MFVHGNQRQTTKHQSKGLPSSDRREHLENNGHTLYPDSCTWTPCEQSPGSEELSPGIYHIPQAYIHIFHSETIIDFKKVVIVHRLICKAKKN